MERRAGKEKENGMVSRPHQFLFSGERLSIHLFVRCRKGKVGRRFPSLLVGTGIGLISPIRTPDNGVYPDTRHGKPAGKRRRPAAGHFNRRGTDSSTLPADRAMKCRVISEEPPAQQLTLKCCSRRQKNRTDRYNQSAPSLSRTKYLVLEEPPAQG